MRGVLTQRLSERELQVLSLYSNGFDGPAAARHLRISITTINSHNKHIFAKLDATNKAHAVAIALREGLIE